MAVEYEIASVITRDDHKKLQEAFGCSRVYIPAKAAPTDAIARVVGMEAAQSISDHYGGEIVHITRRLLVRERNSEIEFLRICGISTDDVASYYGLSARNVRVICQGIKAAGPVFGIRARRLRAIIQRHKRASRDVGRTTQAN